MRAGTGYDLHRLVEGRPLFWRGARFRATGALSATRMPTSSATSSLMPSSGRPARATSAVTIRTPTRSGRTPRASHLLSQSVQHVRSAGFDIVNVDVTVILERPKIAAHVPEIRARLAAALGDRCRAGEREGKDERGASTPSAAAKPSRRMR